MGPLSTERKKGTDVKADAQWVIRGKKEGESPLLRDRKGKGGGRLPRLGNYQPSGSRKKGKGKKKSQLPKPTGGGKKTKFQWRSSVGKRGEKKEKAISPREWP